MGDAQLADSASVTIEGVSEQIRRRRERLGLSKAKLAALAGVDRETLTKVEDGFEITAMKLRQILEALDAREYEYTMEGKTPVARSEPPEDAETIEFTVAGDFGVKVTVKGPIERHELLRADVAEIIRSIRAGDPPTPE